MPLDPQARRLLDQMEAAGALLSPALPVSEQRRLNLLRSARTVEDRQMDGPAGPLPIRIYTPPGPRPLPILVYFHGGGWVLGDLDGNDLRCRVLSDWAGCLVVSVDYRLAPEHRFPAAVEDAYAATCWVAENAGSIAGDRNRIAVGGDSAGGNLAAVVALAARDRGAPGLVYQYLVYPVADWPLETSSYRENAEGYLLSREMMAWFWDQYVPDETSRQDPLASPLRAADLSRLPPAMVITAEYDPLRDEGEAYAVRLQAAGVPVEAKRYHGMIHGFLNSAAALDQGKLAIMDSARALRAAFAPAGE